MHDPKRHQVERSSAIIDQTQERLRREALERKLAERLAARKARRL